MSLDKETLDYSVKIREVFGFRADPAHVEVLASAEDAKENFGHYGFLLTDDEVVQFDERQRRVGEFAPVAEAAAKAAGFGGWLVNEGGKDFTVKLKDATPFTMESLRTIATEPDRLRFDSVKYSLEDLIGDQELLMVAFSEEIRTGIVSGIGVDTKNNGLILTTASSNGDELRKAIPEGVTAPVAIMTDAPVGDHSCQFRGECDSPQRAGVRINPSGATSNYCTSGFAVRKGTDEQVLTAGHCWSTATSGSRYSGSAGFFGSLTSDNAYYGGSQADARLIQTSDSTTNNWIFVNDQTAHATVGQKHAYSTTGVGTFVCLHAYVEQGGKCGPVTYINYNYSSDTCSCMLYNAMIADYNSVPGNSGGPVSSSSGYTAVGLHSGPVGDQGRFTHIQKAEQWLGVTVMTSP
jgi:V8-like Glu-specific endopeptidase